MDSLLDFFNNKIIAHKYSNEYCEDSAHRDIFSETYPF